MRQSVSRKLEAPWTDEQVRALNRYQISGAHPYTCCGENGCRDQLGITNPDGSYNDRVLIATRNGWTCPTCGQVQNWAWESSLATIDIVLEVPMVNLGDIS